MSVSPSLPSIHEIRRRAPLHYWAKADNARFAAYACVSIDREARAAWASSIGYGGETSVALEEAFDREASLALELIIKAVIAQRIEMGCALRDVVRVRPTHDLDKLWNEAELPPLCRDDHRRLLVAKRLLRWAGRYAAPTKDDDYNAEQREMSRGVERQPISLKSLVKPLRFGWDDFDRIYRVAHDAFAELREQLPGGANSSTPLI